MSNKILCSFETADNRVFYFVDSKETDDAFRKLSRLVFSEECESYWGKPQYDISRDDLADYLFDMLEDEDEVTVALEQFDKFSLTVITTEIVKPIIDAIFAKIPNENEIKQLYYDGDETVSDIFYEMMPDPSEYCFAIEDFTF